MSLAKIRLHSNFPRHLAPSSPFESKVMSRASLLLPPCYQMRTLSQWKAHPGANRLITWFLEWSTFEHVVNWRRIDLWLIIKTLDLIADWLSQLIIYPTSSSTKCLKERARSKRKPKSQLRPRPSPFIEASARKQLEKVKPHRFFTHVCHDDPNQESFSFRSSQEAQEYQRQSKDSKRRGEGD